MQGIEKHGGTRPNELGLLSGANCIYAEAGAKHHATQKHKPIARAVADWRIAKGFPWSAVMHKAYCPPGSLPRMQSNGIQLFA
jgi:hypothetical protein